jgi:hypothetical protein
MLNTESGKQQASRQNDQEPRTPIKYTGIATLIM